MSPKLIAGSLDAEPRCRDVFQVCEAEEHGLERRDFWRCFEYERNVEQGQNVNEARNVPAGREHLELYR